MEFRSGLAQQVLNSRQLYFLFEFTRRINKKINKIIRKYCNYCGDMLKKYHPCANALERNI